MHKALPLSRRRAHSQIPENSETGEQAAKRHAHGIFATTAGAYALQGAVSRLTHASFLLLHLAYRSMSTAFSPWQVVLPGTKLPYLAAQKVFWNLEGASWVLYRQIVVVARCASHLTQGCL